jgi:hypothetical protein
LIAASSCGVGSIKIGGEASVEGRHVRIHRIPYKTKEDIAGNVKWVFFLVSCFLRTVSLDFHDLNEII